MASLCPNCMIALRQKTIADAVVTTCGACDGVSINFAVFRRYADEKLAAEIWQRMRNIATRTERKCPHCEAPLATLAFEREKSTVSLSGCSPCQSLWLDRTEIEQLRITFERPLIRMPKPPKQDLPRLDVGASLPNPDIDLDILDLISDLFDL